MWGDTISRKLAEQGRSATPTDELIIRHLVEHPEIWAFSTITKISNLLSIHGSTIVRFARRLGFSGFPELRDAVRAEYLESVTADQEISPSVRESKYGPIVTSVFERELHNMKQTYKHIDGAVLEQTARNLAQAEKVLVFGRRFSFTVAMHTSLLLRSLRPNVRLAPDPGGSNIDSLFDFDERDAALVFSSRRHSPEVHRATTFLTRRGVATTLVTDAAPLIPQPQGLSVLQAYVGSSGALESFTTLGSLGHVLASIVGTLLGDTAERLNELEMARVHFHRPEGHGE